MGHQTSPYSSLLEFVICHSESNLESGRIMWISSFCLMHSPIYLSHSTHRHHDTCCAGPWCGVGQKKNKNVGSGARGRSKPESPPRPSQSCLLRTALSEALVLSPDPHVYLSSHLGGTHSMSLSPTSTGMCLPRPHIQPV